MHFLIQVMREVLQHLAEGEVEEALALWPKFQHWQDIHALMEEGDSDKAPGMCLRGSTSAVALRTHSFPRIDVLTVATHSVLALFGDRQAWFFCHFG